MTAAKNPNALIVGGLMVAAHLALDAVIVLCPRHHYETSTILALVFVAFPLVQVSLVAFWAATSRIRPAIRYSLAISGLVWILSVWLVVEDGLRHPKQSAPWAIAVTFQFVTVAILVACPKVLTRSDHSGTNESNHRRQSTIASFLIWTTILAVILGVGKYMFALAGWTSNLLRKDLLVAPPGTIGVFSAINAVLVRMAVVAEPAKIGRSLAMAVVLVLLTLFQSRLLLLMFGIFVQPSPDTYLSLAGAQIIILLATLVPLRLCGIMGPSETE